MGAAFASMGRHARGSLARAESAPQNPCETVVATVRTGACSAVKGVSTAATSPRETRAVKRGASIRFANGAMSDTSPNAGTVSGNVKSWATRETPRASQAVESRRTRACVTVVEHLPERLNPLVSTSRTWLA